MINVSKGLSISAGSVDTGSEHSNKMPSRDTVAVTTVPLGFEFDESTAGIIDAGRISDECSTCRKGGHAVSDQGAWIQSPRPKLIADRKKGQSRGR